MGRFVSVDPLQHDYPYYTPYQYAGNKPITFIDLDGLEEFKMTGAATVGITATIGIQDVRIDGKISVFGAVQSVIGSAEGGVNMSIGKFVSKFGTGTKGSDASLQWYAGLGFGSNQNMLGWQNPPTSINTPMQFNKEAKGAYGGIGVGQTFLATSGSLSELNNTVGSVFLRGGGSRFSITANIYNDVSGEVLNERFLPIPFLGGGTDNGVTGGGGLSASWISGMNKYTTGFNLDTVTPVRGTNNNNEGEIRSDGTVAKHGIFETLGKHQDLYHQNIYLFENVSGKTNMSLKVGTDDHSFWKIGNMQDNIHQENGYGLFPGWDKNHKKPYFEFSGSQTINN